MNDKPNCTRLYDRLRRPSYRVQLGLSFIPQRNEKSNNQFLNEPAHEIMHYVNMPDHAYVKYWLWFLGISAMLNGVND